ncbi:MAG: hypothetical protein J6W25_05155, partial [Bacilli bacterium]|nr:hypothetical protein [Bacilli bacterium]
ILRCVFAIVIVLAIYFGLVTLWPNKVIILDMIRYFSLLFVGIGIYPLIFRNTRLFRAKEKATE